MGGCVFLVAVVQGWDARRWVRFCDVGVFWPRGVFSAGVVDKVGMRGSRGKLGQAGRNLCAGSGEIPKTLEKAVEGIALRGGFGLRTEVAVGGKGGGVHCRRGFMNE